MASKTTFQVPPEQTPPPPPPAPPRPRRSKREAKLKLSKALGDAAREARLKAGLTQADVAERIGVATEVYGRLERGLLMPSVPTLRRICLALHMSADAMLALSSPQPPVWEEPPPPAEQEQPAMRRLLRNVRKLNSTQIRALSLMASTLRREGED
ncbi:MAG TPA: helix-turn-helix transcriptional regulator [Archangium sp.]|uniref:helix-turn-helix transcriptional regulator n=1 Tax=Archangium sp. TaxID=1872627 RepID=UPI002E2F2A7A|nr:helix-turn-helix transcriptional regulator [Archangium sp.]HEX5750846.1 helix-turn-helix transcriptional regulator [Archangium sp.]